MEDVLLEALAFYADPGSYFGLMVLVDPPSGEFAVDLSPLSEDDEQYFDNYRGDGGTYYGKKAREALAAYRQAKKHI